MIPSFGNKYIHLIMWVSSIFILISCGTLSHRHPETIGEPQLHTLEQTGSLGVVDTPMSVAIPPEEKVQVLLVAEDLETVFMDPHEADRAVCVPYTGEPILPPWVIVVTDVLTLQAKPSLHGERIDVLAAGTRLQFLERTLDAASIEDAEFGTLTAPWYRVRTEDGIEGWCFGGYLALHPLLDLIGLWEAPDMRMIGIDYYVSIHPVDEGLRAVWYGVKEGKILSRTPMDDSLPWDTAYPGILQSSGGRLSIHPDGLDQYIFSLTLVGSNESWTLGDEPVRLRYWAGKWTQADDDPRRLDRDGLAPIHLAARQLDHAALVREIKALGDPDLLCGQGQTALAHLLVPMAMRNQPSCKLVIALLEAGADPNKPQYYQSWTPFSMAASLAAGQGNEEWYAIIRLFLEYGANPNTETQDKWIPGIAVDARDWTLLELLVEFGLVADSEGQGTTLAEYIRHSDSPGMLAVVTSKVPAP